MQDCYLLLLCILIFFFNRTSADEKFPVVVTELTFPSVAVESVPFAIQTGETVNCYILQKRKLDSCSKNVIYNRGEKFLGRFANGLYSSYL